MTSNRELLFCKLHVLLHRSLVEARNLALTGSCSQLYDLADTFEIVPSLMTRWQEEDFDKVRSIVANYQAKYKDTAYDYLSILDMNDDDFRAVYQLTEESVAN